MSHEFQNICSKLKKSSSTMRNNTEYKMTYIKCKIFQTTYPNSHKNVMLFHLMHVGHTNVISSK